VQRTTSPSLSQYVTAKQNRSLPELKGMKTEATHLASVFLIFDYSNIAVTLSRYKAFLEFVSVHTNIHVSVLYRIK